MCCICILFLIVKTFFNPLQIVPESPPGFVAPMVPVPGPVSVRSGSQDESGHANELMRKMEEMKSKKEEEQRLKREKRISDRSVNIFSNIFIKNAPKTFTLWYIFKSLLFPFNFLLISMCY
jgi:hypothetical protein